MSGGTVTVTETDTFNMLLTQIYQELDQFETLVLQFLGFQVTATPMGQQVNQVVVTVASSTTGQVKMAVGYAVLGGGEGYTAPVFHYVQNGASKSIQLTETAQGVLVDAGSKWYVTPNPLTGSTSSKRWTSTQPLSGKASAGTLVFTFHCQYYLTMKVSGSGTVSPSSGGWWYDLGTKVTITATPNSGHKFVSWTGSGAGSYTGISKSHTITIYGAITETASFT
jgi:hypothetical protein